MCASALSQKDGQSRSQHDRQPERGILQPWTSPFYIILFNRRDGSRRAGACCVARRSLPAMRRSLEARVGRVARRVLGTCSARVDELLEPLQGLAPVAFLGAMVARDDQDFRTRRSGGARPAPAGAPCRSIERVLPARSKRSCAAVATLLTFCPPGPAPRTKLMLMSVVGDQRAGRSRRAGAR